MNSRPTRRDMLKQAMAGMAALLAARQLAASETAPEEPKHVVYELGLDSAAALTVRRLRTALLERGLIAVPAGERPHVSVLSCARALPEPQPVADYLARCASFPLKFTPAGAFAGTRPVIYLGIEASAQLRSLQRVLFVLATAQGVPVAEFSHPEKTVFHATIGYSTSEANAVAAVAWLRSHPLPEPSGVERLDLVEYPAGRVLAAFPLNTAKG